MQLALRFDDYPPNEFSEDTQNHILYERLKRGPLRLSELHHKLSMDTARVRDVRKHLKNHGLTVGCKVIAKGETEYQIREV